MKILITGVAGFIGSHLLSYCLHEGHTVIGIDNFLTGKIENIQAVMRENEVFSSRFMLHREDIRNREKMLALSAGVDIIFHEAAIGSVPWSIQDPLLTHETNLTGFLNILEAARTNHVKRVIYASSSAVFGNAVDVPAIEGHEGASLSPYAASKFSQEIYAQAYARCYGLETVGLRYFNVFGIRQDPNGAYAAVIPKWAAAMAADKPCTIFGNGTSTRDYCHVSNIVQANALAMTADLKQFGEKGIAPAFNIGCGQKTSLIELHKALAQAFEEKYGITVRKPEFHPPRMGDIEHSMADISRAKRMLQFTPQISVVQGLKLLIAQSNFDIIKSF
ncbi:MAG: NAD-dependent epimerase/dehydratase family protein [Proteobacteria bacterium]|nr:NAD-dependent epimerase/dehydratase family protein [Pseudomonadota bacterium]